MDMIELTTASAARLKLLAGLIRQREENAEQTGRYLLMHSDELTPGRQEELDRHLNELTASIREMKAEYGSISGEKAQLFN